MGLEDFFANLPEVAKPLKRLTLKEKLTWTAVVLVLYFVLSMLPLYGLSPQYVAQFETLAILLAASFGSIITLGIYAIYWAVSTKNEINSLGANIPTGWLIIIPIANLYWIYKYSEGFAQYVKKDNNTLLWFILYILVGIVMPAIVQSELNKLA